MSTEKQFDKAEAYVLGILPPEERIAFEQELAKNNDLAVEVQLLRLEYDSMRILEQDDLRQQMTTWSIQKREIESSGAKIVPMQKRRFFIRPLSVAASFLVLMVAGWSILQYNYASAALGDDFMLTTTLSDRSNIAPSNPLIDALDAMESKDYTNAIRILDELNGTTYAERALLLKAEIYVVTKDWEKAIPTYEQIIRNGTSTSIVQNAERNLAATYLQMGNKTAAKQLLSKIADNPQHLHQADALQLLKKYNSWMGRLAQ
jgi:tetratricopeptide (TPR) repeat protein